MYLSNMYILWVYFSNWMHINSPRMFIYFTPAEPHHSECAKLCELWFIIYIILFILINTQLCFWSLCCETSWKISFNKRVQSETTYCFYFTTLTGISLCYYQCWCWNCHHSRRLPAISSSRAEWTPPWWFIYAAVICPHR